MGAGAQEQEYGDTKEGGTRSQRMLRLSLLHTCLGLAFVKPLSLQEQDPNTSLTVTGRSFESFITFLCDKECLFVIFVACSYRVI